MGAAHEHADAVAPAHAPATHEPSAQPEGTGAVPASPGWRPNAVDVLKLQRSAGNAAVSGTMSRSRPDVPSRPRLAVQRIGPNGEGMGPPPGLDAASSLPDGYEAADDTGKIRMIGEMLAGTHGNKSSHAYGIAWARMSDAVGQARANTALFKQCLDKDKTIVDLPAFDKLKEQFKKDVEQQALGNLQSNRNMLLEEMKKTGTEGHGTAEAKTAASQADADAGVQEVQKAAAEIERLTTAKARIRAQSVGYEKKIVGQLGFRRVGGPVAFDPGGPPTFYESTPEFPTWEQVNEQWRLALATEAKLIQQHPVAAHFLGGEGNMGKLKDSNDIEAARAEIGKGLAALLGKVEAAVPLIGDDLTFLDFPPIHQQLLGGGASPSGTKWGNPLEKAVATDEIGDANITHLLATLGVSSIAAAAFILASIATAGGAAVLGGVLFAGGAIASGAQAANSWDKYNDLSTANKATVDPSLALVSQDQVDDAMVSAIIDTIFAFLDVAQAAKGAYVGLKGGKAILEAGKVGLESSARGALPGLRSAPNPQAVVLKALAEVGPEETKNLSKLPYEELADIAGKESEAGKRFLALASGTISSDTKELLAKLPMVVGMNGADGEKVLAAAVSTYGCQGTIDKLGGWAAIKNSAAFKEGTASVKAMESWRHGITVTEMQAFITKESDAMSKLVRTGTEKAASDVDVQILGGAAAELQTRAEGWLAGRLGTDVKGAKKLLDAEIFVDPLRSHMIDVMKELPAELRAEISTRMAGKERSMIFGAQYQEALKTSEEAAQKVLDKAKDAGVNVMKDFKPLDASQRSRLSLMIDGKMKALAQETDVAKKAAGVEEIAEMQARINASHPDAYAGGGVRVWVSGRGDDADKIAKALGIDPADLKAATAAQHLTAALTEAKWLEAAVKNLSVAKAGDDAGKIAKTLADIGKHGARSAEGLGKAGASNAARLQTLADRLMVFKNMKAEELVAKIEAGELSSLRSQIMGDLQSLEKSSKNALKSLGDDAKVAGADVAQMSEWQSLQNWQIRYATVIAGAGDATEALVSALGAVARESAKASLPEPEPNRSEDLAPAPDPAPAPAP